MDTSYLVDLRVAIAKSDEEEWWLRTTRCARRILTAVCFRETSENTYRQTSSVLLAPIGFYYSVFHIGIAMLYMEHSTSPEELKHMRHSTLESLVKDRLVNRKIISGEYIKTLRKLREYREYANYVFGERLTRYEYKSVVSELYEQTEAIFDSALTFIQQVQVEVCAKHGLYYPIQTAIGDGFGDDLIRAYLSELDEQRVQSYLLAKDLTT